MRSGKIERRKRKVGVGEFRRRTIEVRHFIGQVVHWMAEMRQAHHEAGLRISCEHPAIVDAIDILERATIELAATVTRPAGSWSSTRDNSSCKRRSAARNDQA